MKSADIPRFGTLSGMKVVVAAVSTAGGVPAQKYAEQGADVIWVEPPIGQDPLRWTAGGWGIENERRNVRSMCLNVQAEKGRELFFNLIESTDVFIEASRGGQWSGWGITDEVLWEHNPKLVICHMSGYGQTGVPEFVKRSAYDHTTQAYSGMLQLNGFPDRDPALAMKFPTDYYAGLCAFGETLAAYICATKTGKGESIDLAQYEISASCQSALPGQWLNQGKQEVRDGSKRVDTAGVGYYTCKDGKGVYCIFIGAGVLRKIIPLFGLEYGSELFPKGVTRILTVNKEATAAFEEVITKYLSSKTAIEAETELCAMGIPISRVMDYQMMEEDEHYKARETFIEWESVTGGTIKGVAPVPRFQNHPAQIWRGCPSIGMDNDDILEELGYSQSEIDSFYDDKLIKQDDMVRITTVN
ncbi:MAG: CoA transferase [Gordonibacter sp.]|uniref:CoA transferase n=1 Tax=Gordonibacter sp. TaxID=1968902 RepID=UPI002FC5B549